MNYFKLKHEKFEEDFRNMEKYLVEGNEEMQIHMDMIKDEETKLKFQMMYDYNDYDNERTVLRDKFLKDVSKRADLKDVGEILDKLTW